MRPPEAPLRFCAPLAIALLLAPYLVMVAWSTRHLQLAGGVGCLLISMTLLIALASVTRTLRSFLLWHFPLFVLGAAFAAYTLISEQLPGYPLAYVLATTSWEEVRGFFGLAQGARALLLLMVLCGGYLLLAVAVPAGVRLPAARPRLRWALIGSLALLAAIAAYDPDQSVAGLFANPVIGAARFFSGPLASVHVAVDRPLQRKRPYGAVRSAGDEVHVLIIGESSRRDSWSLYGYPRATTPYLDSISSELVVFARAVADANLTIYAVPMVITGMAPATFDFHDIRGSIVDLAREAGYHTSWLANQDPHAEQLAGVQVDGPRFPPAARRPGYVVYPPDGVLLPDFARALQRGGPLFVGMHVYGSHWPYTSRYPPSFAHFGVATLPFTAINVPGERQQVTDCYDDSIRYTDWFLRQVIEQARRLSVPATVTYLSDHGEDLQALDGRSGHGASEYTRHVFEIPAFVWMNAAYRHAHPEKAAALAANASAEVRSHDFFYSLADIMGIRWAGYLPRRSFASPQFVPDVAEMHIAGGKLVPRTESAGAVAEREGFEPSKGF
jgi:glucan phosphoethanolaminetransferase (alkaline phosphatase superfamily)